ncbi:hypothetical protein IWW57_002231, partial [Coemansia sp. S610]
RDNPSALPKKDVTNPAASDSLACRIASIVQKYHDGLVTRSQVLSGHGSHIIKALLSSAKRLSEDQEPLRVARTALFGHEDVSSIPLPDANGSDQDAPRNDDAGGLLPGVLVNRKDTRSVPHAPFRKTHLAKKVIALADVWQNLCDGKFCEVITLPRYETLSFPSAKFLELRLSKAVKQEVAVAHNSQSPSAPTPEIGREQVASVARALLRLVPTVIDMDMTVCTIGDMEPNYIQLYEWLVTELCRGRVDRLQIWSWTRGAVLPLRLNDISGLTSITRGKNVSNSAFSRLAYLNAGTLKTLEILLTEVDWLDLIFGDTDDPVVYANLASLKLEIGEIPYGITWAAIEAVEPFPVLATLELSGGYPFADDLLFRGNGGTLQNLCLPFSALCRNALGRFNVLRRSAVTRMNSIRIDEAVDADQAFLIENADFAFEQQVHHILEVAYSLVLPSDPEEYRLYHSLLSAPKAAILQRLDFGDLVFSASGLFEVVAALPSLSTHTILEYLEGYPRGHVGPTTARYFDRKAVLAPLLLVGEHWCTAALAAICETCELRFIRRRNAIKVTFPAWPDGAPYLEYYKTPFVRRVIVSANLWDDLCDGAFSWTISMSQYENLVFPSATTLLLYFSRPANSHLVNTHRSWYEPATNDWRVTEAAQSLLRLVPDVAHVSVQVCSISDKEPHFVQFYNRMIVELCQGNVSSLNLHS